MSPSVWDEQTPGTICLTFVQPGGKFAEQACPSISPPETTSKFYLGGFAKAVERGKEEDVPVKASQAAQVLRKSSRLFRESARTEEEGRPQVVH